MQLQRLTIHNIASIEDAEIDFSGSQLGKAPIFLICGETGAGKTTILDAICLALYGETPRMTSVSKEEIELTELTDSRVEKYYSNDNSQLLHRGAGEGFSRLTFIGNDDKEYEAEWEVHRAHNKAHKRLLRPTRTLIALDGSYSENRIAEIKSKVIELTGLEFDQFCRTVMLAQGEFTKFLKSNKSEKSEILEKLTGTEIYTLLGMRIAEHYNAAKNQWQKIKEDIERYKISDDEEIESKKQRKVEIEKIINDYSNNRIAIEKKISWIDTSSKNEENLKQCRENLSALEDSRKSESFVHDMKLVGDYEASAVGMKVLDNLKKTEAELKKNQTKMPDIVIELEKSVKNESEAENKYKEFEKETSEKERVLDELNLEKLGQRYQSLVKRDGMLSEILTHIEKQKGEENALNILESQKADLLKRRDENIQKGENLREPVKAAEQELNRWTEALNKAEVSVSDIIKDIRSQLKKGDTCPVCGSEVSNDIDDSYFESLLTPIRESKKRAYTAYVTLKANEEAAVKLVETDDKEIKTLIKKIDKCNTTLNDLKAESLKLLREAGFNEISYEEVRKECEVERESLRKESEAIRELQMKGESLQKDLKKLRKKLKEALEISNKAKETVANLRILQQETNGVIKNLESTIEGYWEDLRQFFIKNPDVTMSRLNELNNYVHQDVQTLKERLIAVEDSIKIEKGKLEAIEIRIKEHSEIKPEFEDFETKESLLLQSREAEEMVKRLSEESGSIAESLEQELRVRKEVEKRKSELQLAAENLEKWDGLYNKLGDLKGVKFRAIAQSFILSSLLDNANIYMRSFNDRYTLTCNPGTLTILVQDDYKPSEPQPASILSGGESFMASLSLALALSNLRSGGMSVDILFIDEGFGTLSAEYLGNVMDTLEKLHQIGGRKVGLISHVAEMKERIPVQIRVHRESPAISKVEIVEI